jgi:hypothetical protein
MAAEKTVEPSSGSEPDVVLFGFERSAYVNVVRLVLLAKGVPFARVAIPCAKRRPSWCATCHRRRLSGGSLRRT